MMHDFVVLFVVHCGRTVMAVGATYRTQTSRHSGGVGWGVGGDSTRHHK